jgi:transcriptional regulator with XRE-family HTH domain
MGARPASWVMGRSQTQPKLLGYQTGYAGARLGKDNHWHEWAMIVGDRLRRLRAGRRWTLAELSCLVARPDGGGYSPGYLGKIERGVAYAPLFVYLKLAELYEVHPSLLFAQDEVLKGVNEVEMTLVRVVREARVDPSDAIVRILGPARSVDQG